MEEVEGEYRMRDEAAPEVVRERWWEAGKAGNEVTLEGVNGLFGYFFAVAKVCKLYNPTYYRIFLRKLRT